MPLEQTRDAIRAGDLLGAYDAAVAGIAAGQASRELHYLLVLTLARMGDTDRAHALFLHHDLASEASEDVLSLRARILKDRAIAATGPARAALLAAASAAYQDANTRFGGYYSLINAASLSCLAGDVARGHDLARRVLADPEVAAPTSYFAAASAAEAWLLLGDAEPAIAAATRACALPDAGLGPRGSTVRQLLWLGRQAAVSAALAERLCSLLRPPPILFYSGHLFVEDPAIEAAIAARIDAALAASGTAIAYGALACGADILFAEGVLRRGADLHVVLPFSTGDFIAESVLPGGAGWLPRFEAVLSAARDVTFASEAAYIGDPAQFQHGNSLAMGLAVLRASHLQTAAELVTVWDGAAARGVGGTGAYVDHWRSLGHAARIIDPGAIVRPPVAAGRRVAPATTATRCQRAILFTDYAGFSRIGEHDLPPFWADVMGAVAGVLASAGTAIDFRNSWGDAVFAVVDDLQVAARVAIDIVAAIPAPADAGGMRVALHYGPVYRMIDPITGLPGYIGTEVTRAARIEPVTPIGQVYVTQPFAAMLALERDAPFRLEYAGRVTLAKGYGTMALYRLSR
ncbi:tetratricopeptide repeat-containing protein [Sandarakinorhabdus sp. DWP1-3-1]|uniref:tetratricopeptide repeat-containing protein n=1 Tax=Sandarakinorhabdus sp. DWP1-3-1 TaxID=2804627 RepID=UPI003CF3120B